MNKQIAVLYGPTGGSTEKVAKLIQEKLSEEKCILIPVMEANIDSLNHFDNIIFGVSTIGTHTWSDSNSPDWDAFILKLRKANLTGKTVAIFGLGDQVAYANNFVDDMKLVYNVVIENGAKHVGSWPTDDYDFNESESVVDGKFVGLAIDEDHQSEFTPNRVNNWIDQIVPLFKL